MNRSLFARVVNEMQPSTSLPYVKIADEEVKAQHSISTEKARCFINECEFKPEAPSQRVVPIAPDTETPKKLDEIITKINELLAKVNKIIKK